LRGDEGVDTAGTGNGALPRNFEPYSRFGMRVRDQFWCSHLAAFFKFTELV